MQTTNVQIQSIQAELLKLQAGQVKAIELFRAVLQGMRALKNDQSSYGEKVLILKELHSLSDKMMTLSKKHREESRGYVVRAQQIIRF